MRVLLLCLCVFAVAFRGPRIVGPDKPAYRLYDARLKPTTYAKLLQQAANADVVLFGELHNNPICHWLQLELTKDLATRSAGKLVLGAEMFESDNQTALSSYVQGQITDQEFAAQMRLWPNYETDYKPVVDFAREQKIPFIATNVPRKYATLVARQGLAALDTLPADAKKQIAPLPLTVDLTLPGYAAMLDMMGVPSHGGPGASSHGSSGAASPHGGMSDMAERSPAANFARAQAIKDATMAYFILQNRQPGQTLLHLNGDYHSKNFEGISWYLHKQQPTLKILTISSIEIPNVDKPARTDETRNLANFVIAIADDMTKTY
ncbi:MAG: ChaN family lipoprotein [Spirosoma sp.]|nr:ChaN family lipoprotein [Spirosoma sp.]